MAFQPALWLALNLFAAICFDLLTISCVLAVVSFSVSFPLLAALLTHLEIYCQLFYPNSLSLFCFQSLTCSSKFCVLSFFLDWTIECASTSWTYSLFFGVHCRQGLNIYTLTSSTIPRNANQVATPPNVPALPLVYSHDRPLRVLLQTRFRLCHTHITF